MYVFLVFQCIVRSFCIILSSILLSINTLLDRLSFLETPSYLIPRPPRPLHHLHQTGSDGPFLFVVSLQHERFVGEFDGEITAEDTTKHELMIYFLDCAHPR